ESVDQHELRAWQTRCGNRRGLTGRRRQRADIGYQKTEDGRLLFSDLRNPTSDFPSTFNCSLSTAFTIIYRWSWRDCPYVVSFKPRFFWPLSVRMARS